MDSWFVRRYDLFFRAAKKLLPDNTNVLIIGANDGSSRDPARQVWREGWHGYFIEPNPQAYEKLYDFVTDNDVIIPYAISEKTGTLSLWSMTPEMSEAYAKVTKDHGSCFTSFNREHIVSHLKKKLPSKVKALGIKNMVKEITVECFSLYDIMEKYRITKVDLVQIDTEGMDRIMVEQLVYCIQHRSIKPRLILFEHRHLSEEDAEAAREALRNERYTVEIMRNDTIAYRDV
jgi:FkbM family methyltransferase